jgi:hypothetical protein
MQYFEDEFYTCRSEVKRDLWPGLIPYQNFHFVYEYRPLTWFIGSLQNNLLCSTCFSKLTLIYSTESLEPKSIFIWWMWVLFERAIILCDCLPFTWNEIFAFHVRYEVGLFLLNVVPCLTRIADIVGTRRSNLSKKDRRSFAWFPMFSRLGPAACTGNQRQIFLSKLSSNVNDMRIYCCTCICFYLGGITEPLW